MRSTTTTSRPVSPPWAMAKPRLELGESRATIRAARTCAVSASPRLRRSSLTAGRAERRPRPSIEKATDKRSVPVATWRSWLVSAPVSLKAGGAGINLTTADTVIHYDPWWNPAAEAQASDRAHRIGQKNPVFVHKLICENTIEERILKMQQKKAALVEGLLSGRADKLQLTQADIQALFMAE